MGVVRFTEPGVMWRGLSSLLSRGYKPGTSYTDGTEHMVNTFLQAYKQCLGKSAA
jgi:hypothetical protein